MGITDIVFLGIGLAMDCFAVSLSKGMAANKLYLSKALFMALVFGLFQAGMPLIGYWAGSVFADFIGRIAPWLALILLGFIGGRMIKEHFSSKGKCETGSADYGLGTVLMLAVATSIDALATGLVFVGGETGIWLAISVIGVCSFAFSLLGTFLGVCAGRKFCFPANLVGGLILVGIGLKIWVEGVLF